MVLFIDVFSERQNAENTDFHLTIKIDLKSGYADLKTGLVC